MKRNEMNEKLKYYLSLDYPMFLSHDKEEGIYVVQFPDLPGCMAHGSTHTSAIKLAEEIKKEWIADSLESGVHVPVPKKEEEYSGKFVIRIPGQLHKRLSEQAEREGRSLNQHVGFLLSERSAAYTVEKYLDRLSQNTNTLDRIITQITGASTYGSTVNFGKTIGGQLMPVRSDSMINATTTIRLFGRKI